MKVGDIIAADLPPEPRVGTVVRDKLGDLWERKVTPAGVTGWTSDTPRRELTWAGLLIHWAPLTVVTEAPPMPEPPTGTVITHAGRVFARSRYLGATRTILNRWLLLRGPDVEPGRGWYEWWEVLDLDPAADPVVELEHLP